MGRAKMVIKFIEDRKSRNVTFNKRKEGLKKKAFEFSTLCDVDACMICFREDSNEPLTWPEERSEVERIVRRYLCIDKEERKKRQLDLSTFLDEKKKKMEEKLIRSQQGEDASCKPIYPCWDDRLSYWSEESLRNLATHLDGKMEMVRKRIQLLKDSSNRRLLQQPNHQQQQQQQQQHMQVSKFDDELQPLPLSYLKPLEQQQYYSGVLPESLHTPATAFEFGGLMPNASNLGKFNYSSTNSLSSSSSLPLLMNPGARMVPFMSSTPPGVMMGSESNEIFAYNASSFHQEQWFHGHGQHFGPSDFQPSSPLHFQRMLLYPQAHHLDHGRSEFH